MYHVWEPAPPTSLCWLIRFLDVHGPCAPFRHTHTHTQARSLCTINRRYLLNMAHVQNIVQTLRAYGVPEDNILGIRWV